MSTDLNLTDKSNPINKSGQYRASNHTEPANIASVQNESYKPAENATSKTPANVTEEMLEELMPNTSTDTPVLEKSSSNMLSVSVILASLSLLLCSFF